MTPLQALSQKNSFEDILEFLSLDELGVVPRHRRVPLLRLLHQELATLSEDASLEQIRSACRCAKQRLDQGQTMATIVHCDSCRKDYNERIQSRPASL